ncbi:hypothetical protein ACHAWF_007520 [Thalassiosira exigua]
MNWRYDPENFANRNSDVNAAYSVEEAGVGRYKHVFKATYDNGNPAVAKFLKSGATFSDECFLVDIKSAEEALPIIAQFQRYIDDALGAGRVSLKINIPQVWRQTSGLTSSIGQRMLVEPFIANFRKFNSNTGAKDAQAAIAQTFSHFSYHATDGQWLLCDLQGGMVGNNKYTLTDIVINSRDKRFGVTDLGVAGIETFLSQHQCNQFCCREWRGWQGAQVRIPVRMGSTTAEYNNATMQPAGKVILRPSTIFFTQDSIKNIFRCGRSLLQTMNEIAAKELHKRDVPKMRVVFHNGRYHSLDNRRLAVFRVLEFRGLLNTIRCTSESWSTASGEYHLKRGTGYGVGESIAIRRTGWRIGASARSTTFPLGEVNVSSTDPILDDGAALRFLASITDE